MSNINPIESSYLNPVAGSAEAVSPEVKKQYDDILKAMQDILLKPKSSLTDQDTEQYDILLGQLRDLEKKGITPEMADFANLLIGLVPYNATTGSFECDMTTLKSMSDITLTLGGKKVSLTEALGTNIDPTATQTLGDSLIDGANWIYSMYTEQLADLKKQLDIATASLNNLQAITDTLNMTKTDSRGNYVYPPQSWDDIPKDLQNQIRNDHPEWFAPGDHSSDPTNLNAVLNYTKTDGYVKMSETYFNKVETPIADPQPNATEALQNLIKSRDALQDQIDKFDQMNKDNPGSVDTGAGSPYAANKQVLDDLNKYFPPNVYSKGCTLSDQKIIVNPYPDPWGGPPGSNTITTVTIVTKPDGTTTQIDPLKAISDYINAGQAANNPIKNHIDAAVSANQNLSSKMSDEIKAKNTTLQEFFDIFTALADALNKIILSAARGQ